MQVKKNQIFTLLAIICFVILTRNLFILRFVLPVGYVEDIYSMFPLSFYLAFMLCYLIATFLMLNGKKALGVLILCLNHFEILIIPYMLGYYSMGRGDDMAYIGEYLQIATSGHFASWDIYPASHIIGASISVMCNLEANSISFIIPIVFSFIFIAGIYLFSRELFPDSCIHSLVLVSSFILYLGIYNFSNVPNALFFAFMPVYLYCVYKYFSKHPTIQFSIIFVLMTLILPFTHPFIVFFLIVVFFFHLVPRILPTSNTEVLRIPKIRVTSFVLLALSFMVWFLYNDTLLRDLRSNYLSYINKISESTFLQTSDKLTKIHLSIFDYMQLISFYYGRFVFPTLIIFIGLIFIYFNKDAVKRDSFKNYPYLIVLYIVFLVIEIILMFNPIITHQPDRLTNLNFVVYAQVPLFACALYLLLLEKSKSYCRILLVCGILLFVWSFSLFGCFDSPNVSRDNVALTYNEVSGMNWFYKVKDNSLISIPLSQLDRFHDLFGNPETKDDPNSLPPHFGYSNNSNNFMQINFKPNSSSYVIILTIDELMYQVIPAYVHIGRYNKSDFVRFRTDLSVNKIYDSTNIKIFKSYRQND